MSFAAKKSTCKQLIVLSFLSIGSFVFVTEILEEGNVRFINTPIKRVSIFGAVKYGSRKSNKVYAHAQGEMSLMAQMILKGLEIVETCDD